MSFMVCGWYTPDYAHWLERLAQSLDRINAGYSFALVQKRDGTIEQNMSMKATQVRAAMAKFPRSTIIFLDVDCEVLGPLDDLAELDCDFGCFMQTEISKRSVKLHTWSGTLLFQPTARARAMVEIWEQESAKLHKRATDQTSLALAMSRVPGLRITALERKWCAYRGEPGAVIAHDSASAEIKAKASWWGFAA